MSESKHRREAAKETIAAKRIVDLLVKNGWLLPSAGLTTGMIADEIALAFGKITEIPQLHLSPDDLDDLSSIIDR